MLYIVEHIIKTGLKPLIKIFVNKNFYEAPKNNNFKIIIFLSDQKPILAKS